MTKQQARAARAHRMAQMTLADRQVRHAGTASRDIAARPEPVKAAVGPVRNRKGTKLTATQRNSEGNHSEWNRSHNLRPATTPMIAAWGRTVREM